MTTMDDKDFLPDTMEVWEVRDSDGVLVETIHGDMIGKDKRISNISSGYTHYFRTEKGLKTYSAFSYNVEKIEIIGAIQKEAPPKPDYGYEIGKEYYSVGALGEGGIEQWKFSNDRYDQRRMELGILFETRSEALHFKDQLIKITKGLSHEL
mgnify:CR=1 FL=1